MKYVLLLSALLLISTAPALCAPSDADMSFAPAGYGGGGKVYGGGRQPTAADAGPDALAIRGNGGGATNAGPLDGASNGSETGNRSRRMTEAQMYWGGNKNMDTWTSKNGASGDIWPTASPEAGFSDPTRARASRVVTQSVGLVETGLMSPNSVGRKGFAGPQDLGFKWSGFPITPYAMKFLGASSFSLPQTGTGSVDASICAPNGKD